MLKNVKTTSSYLIKMAPFVVIQASVWAPPQGGGGSGGSGGITGIVGNITGALSSIMELVSMVAYVAGFIFFLAAVFKFKQHKDNPTQVPVGTPLSMLVMSAALMFAGNFITPLGESIFGSASAGVQASGLRSGLQSGGSGSP